MRNLKDDSAAIKSFVTTKNYMQFGKRNYHKMRIFKPNLLVKYPN